MIISLGVSFLETRPLIFTHKTNKKLVAFIQYFANLIGRLGSRLETPKALPSPKQWVAAVEGETLTLQRKRKATNKLLR